MMMNSAPDALCPATVPAGPTPGCACAQCEYSRAVPLAADPLLPGPPSAGAPHAHDCPCRHCD